jgi:hypothetical protein
MMVVVLLLLGMYVSLVKKYCQSKGGGFIIHPHFIASQRLPEALNLLNCITPSFISSP